MIGRLLWWLFTRLYRFEVSAELLEDLARIIREEGEAYGQAR